jgi:hypothetical protein
MTRSTTRTLAIPASLLFGPTAGAAEPDKLREQAPSRFTNVSDIRVHYKSLGKGDTALVLIHGWHNLRTFQGPASVYHRDGP